MSIVWLWYYRNLFGIVEKLSPQHLSWYLREISIMLPYYFS